MVLFTNCVTATKIDENLYNQNLTKSFPYSKEKTFNATLAALNELKIPVEKVEKDKGIIVTEKVPFFNMTLIRGTQYGNQYNSNLSATGHEIQASHKYYFQIIGDKTNTTVKTVKYRLWQNQVEQTELNAQWCKENVWDPFFKEIQVKLDGF